MFGNVVDEKALAAEAAKHLKPMLDDAIKDAAAQFRLMVGEVLDGYEVTITFRRKQ